MFISRYTPGDCCHLNGLATRKGQVNCVTALGETDQPHGWRSNKRDGGVLIDVASNEVMVRGLSMPHSPRWYDDKLYLLQSGNGGFGVMDPATGHYESIVELSGFTRGFAFCAAFAFVGLSQIRETAVFGGVPIAERQLIDRSCGVWGIHIQSGQIVAFVKFEEAIQEIFAVDVDWLDRRRTAGRVGHDADRTRW